MNWLGIKIGPADHIAPTANATGLHPVIGLEGGICAGKTTLGRSLSTALGLPYVPEYMDLLTASEIAHLQSLDYRASFHFFLLLNRRRDNLYALPGGVILDRTFLTLLSFNYAMMRLGHISDFSDINQALAHESFCWPTIVLFLRVSETERQRRFHATRLSIPFPFLDSGFNDHLNAFFTTLSETLSGFHLISTDNLGVAHLVADVALLATTSVIDRHAVHVRLLELFR